MGSFDDVDGVHFPEEVFDPQNRVLADEKDLQKTACAKARETLMQDPDNAKALEHIKSCPKCSKLSQ